MGNLIVIVTGTDPQSRRGGIAFALPGYFAAMESVEIRWEFIATHHATERWGKWWWWMRAVPRLWRLVRMAQRQEERVVVYGHAGPGISLARQGSMLALGRLMGAKTVMQLHAIKFDHYLRSFWQRWLFKLALSGACGIAVLTPWWRERLLEGGVNKAIYVVPNPLPKVWEDKASLEQESYGKRSDGEINVLAISRVEAGKGVELLLLAMTYLTDNVRLVIAGDGRLLSTLRRRAESLGLGGRVEFSGWVDGNEKQRLIDRADLFCLPTSYDSFGMGFLEAMANGLPVVALNWGPIRDVVPHGRAGILVDNPQPKVVADGIRQLMDVEVRRRMGAEGRRWVLDRFSASRVGVELRRMLEDLTAE